MKNFNLCLITLIYSFFLFTHNSCRASTISLIVQHPSGLTEIMPDGNTDPDWKILIGHFSGNTVFREQMAL